MAESVSCCNQRSSQFFFQTQIYLFISLNIYKQLCNLLEHIYRTIPQYLPYLCFQVLNAIRCFNDVGFPSGAQIFSDFLVPGCIYIYILFIMIVLLFVLLLETLLE